MTLPGVWWLGRPGRLRISLQWKRVREGIQFIYTNCMLIGHHANARSRLAFQIRTIQNHVLHYQLRAPLLVIGILYWYYRYHSVWQTRQITQDIPRFRPGSQVSDRSNPSSSIDIQTLLLPLPQVPDFDTRWSPRETAGDPTRRAAGRYGSQCPCCHRWQVPQPWAPWDVLTSHRGSCLANEASHFRQRDVESRPWDTGFLQ